MLAGYTATRCVCGVDIRRLGFRLVSVLLSIVGWATAFFAGFRIALVTALLLLCSSCCAFITIISLSHSCCFPHCPCCYTLIAASPHFCHCSPIAALLSLLHHHYSARCCLVPAFSLLCLLPSCCCILTTLLAALVPVFSLLCLLPSCPCIFSLLLPLFHPFLYPSPFFFLPY